MIIIIYIQSIVWYVYFFFGPTVFVEVVLEDEVLVVGVAEEEDLGALLELIVEELVRVAVRKLHQRVLQVPDALKHLVHN